MSVERSPRSSALALAGFGFGVVAVAVVASVPGSPLHPILPPGVQPGGPFRWLADTLGMDGLEGAALVAAGVVSVAVVVVSFLFVLREAWLGAMSVWTVVIAAVVAHVVVLTLPLLLSRDVYSYIAYGSIAGIHHANPYVRTPADFPRDAVAMLVGPKWFAVPAVYGPLFTGFASLVVRTFHGLAAQVAVFRLAAAAASLGTVAVIATTVRSTWPHRAAFAVAVFGLNPVVLFQSVASGHNDLVVALCVAGAFALVTKRRYLPAVAVLALGTLVKAPAALPLILLLVWCVARAHKGRRLHTLLTHGGLAAVIGVAFAAPFFQLHDPTLGMLELAGHEGWLAPSRFFRRLLDGVSGDTLGVIARVGFAALLLVSLFMVARAVWRSAATDPAIDEIAHRELGAAWAWALMLLMLLGPVLLPWYVVWALPLAWLLPRAPRFVLVGVSVALAVSQWAAEPARFPGPYDANVLVGHYAITPIVIGLLGWLLLDGYRRRRDGLPLRDEEGDAGGAGTDRDEHGAEAPGER